MGDKIIEQVGEFKFLGFRISTFVETDIKMKIEKFNEMCGTNNTMLHNKVKKESMIRLHTK